MGRSKRNKDRFYVYECPECGARVEFIMNMKKHDSVYTSWCHVCGNDMRRVDPNDNRE
jgi:transcription elongation factor Elf1